MLSSSLSKLRTWILMGLIMGEISFLPKYSKKSGFCVYGMSLIFGMVVGTSVILKSSILMGVWIMLVFFSLRMGVLSSSKSPMLGSWLIHFYWEEKQS